MFRGEYVHTVDAKGRVSIPTGFRTELQRRSDQPPMLSRMSQCLRLYPYEEWCEYEAEIIALSAVNPDVERFRRMVLSGASSSKIDAQGRLLIPPVYREHSKIDHEVTIVGVGKYMELWDKSRFDTELSDAQERYYEITSTVTGLER